MSQLAPGWHYSSLAQLGGLVGGKTPSKAIASYWQGGTVPWVSPKDMKQQVLLGSEDAISQQAVREAGMQTLPKDTVLMVTRSGILSHSFPVARTSVPCTINQDIKAWVPTPAANPRYLARLLQSLGPRILRDCAKAGTTVASVDATLLQDVPLPLAPLAEQQRIADKLDAVTARVDACRDRLARVAPLLKRFRQSVLDAAMSGELTSDLTARFGATPRLLSDLGTVSGGLTKNAKRAELPMSRPYLRVANVQTNALRLDDVSAIGLTDAEYEKTRLVKGDLLIVEGNGSIEQIGRVAIWNDEIPDCSHQNHLIRWRAGENVIPDFVLFFLLSPEGRRQIEAVASSTTGLHTLSVSKVGNLCLPLPSLALQSAVVSRVKSLFAFADRLEARLAKAQAAADRLTPALLAKAFRGELVPQDPADEPAAELLQRLAASRPAAGPRRSRSAQAR